MTFKQSNDKAFVKLLFRKKVSILEYLYYP